MQRLPFTPLVSTLPSTVPFVGPEALERWRGRPLRLRIGANESAFGVSPRAARAMRAAMKQIAWYADPEGHDLRSALAHQHGVDRDEICLGAGIDELLGLVVRLVVEPGTPVVSSLGAYPTFNYHVEGFGGALHREPYRDDRIDLEALAAATRRLGAPLVYLANPDNPMGTWHGAAAVRYFIDALPGDSLLILDEAYLDFAPEPISPSVDVASDPVIRMRTFSKAHGMAGARIGYAIAAKEVITGLNKVRNHFGINRIAQAGALASLEDEAFIRRVVNKVAAGRKDYAALAVRLGLTTLPSATNFVAFDVGDGDRARRLLAALLERDVFVRMPSVAPLDRCIRVTVGTPEERALFAHCLEEALADI